MLVPGHRVRLAKGSDSQVETWRPSKYCAIWLLSFCALAYLAFQICARLHPKVKWSEPPQNYFLSSEIRARKWAVVWTVSCITLDIFVPGPQCFTHTCTINNPWTIELSRELLYGLAVESVMRECWATHESGRVSSSREAWWIIWGSRSVSEW